MQPLIPVEFSCGTCKVQPTANDSIRSHKHAPNPTCCPCDDVEYNGVMAVHTFPCCLLQSLNVTHDAFDALLDVGLDFSIIRSKGHRFKRSIVHSIPLTFIALVVTAIDVGLGP